jgi:predicted RND superfamily exporter protein
MSMTSTKSFSTKNAGVLVVAVFSIVAALGLSQVSSAMAVNELLNCDTEVANESSDFDMQDATSCIDQDNDAVSSNDEDEDNDSNGDESETKSVLTTGPAVASSDDNIIKPINLNKGGESDEPLEVKNANNKQSADSVSKQVFEDEMDLGDQLSKNTNTDVSEFYESFDLPYTAIYKEPVN